MRKCITISEYTKKNGTKVGEHERCFDLTAEDLDNGNQRQSAEALELLFESYGDQAIGADSNAIASSILEEKIINTDNDGNVIIDAIFAENDLTQNNNNDGDNNERSESNETEQGGDQGASEDRARRLGSGSVPPFGRFENSDFQGSGGGSRRISILDRDVEFINSFTPSEKLKKNLLHKWPDGHIPKDLIELESGQDYADLMAAAKPTNKFMASVDIQDASVYDGMRLFITEDGASGVALSSDGNLGSGFSNQSLGRKNQLPPLMVLAIQQGATKADAFNTVLPNYYSQFGFKPVTRLKWNDEFAPDGWDKELYKGYDEGEPDVVFMAWDGGDRNKISDNLGKFDNVKALLRVKEYEKSDYDGAESDRDAQIPKLNTDCYSVPSYTRKSGSTIKGYEVCNTKNNKFIGIEPEAVRLSTLKENEIISLAEKVQSRSLVQEPETTKAIEEIVGKLGGKMIGLDYAVKLRDSIERKIDKEALALTNDGDLDVTLQDVLIEDLNDTLRYTAIFEPKDYTKGFNDTVAALEAEGYKKYKIKPTWNSNGYKAINTNFIKDGNVIELQFHTPQSKKTVEPSHKLYDIARLVDTPADVKLQLEGEMADMWAKVAVPKGADKIERYEDKGAKPDHYNDRFQPVFDNIEDIDTFKSWSKGYPVLEAQEIAYIKPGEKAILKTYHGTTHDFYEFRGSDGNQEGFLGATNYFTSSENDAKQNYSSLDGPDLSAKIELDAEQMQYTLEEEYGTDVDDVLDVESIYDNFGITDDDVKEMYGDETELSAFDYAKLISTKRNSGDFNQVMELVVRVENPIVIDPSKRTWLDNYDAVESEDLEYAWDELKEEMDYTEDQKEDLEDEIYERAEGNKDQEPQVYNALREAWYESNAIEDFKYQEFNLYDSEIEVNDLREQISSKYPMNEEGRFIVGDIFNKTLINLGYDSVILANANKQFSTMGMEYGTSHVHIPDEYRSNLKLFDGRNVRFDNSSSIIDFEQVDKKITDITNGTKYQGLTLREVLSTAEGRAFWRDRGISLLPEA